MKRIVRSEPQRKVHDDELLHTERHKRVVEERLAHDVTVVDHNASGVGG